MKEGILDENDRALMYMIADMIEYERVPQNSVIKVRKFFQELNDSLQYDEHKYQTQAILDYIEVSLQWTNNNLLYKI